MSGTGAVCRPIDILDYNISEYPPWRNATSDSTTPVSAMIDEIVRYQEQWKNMKDSAVGGEKFSKTLQKMTDYFVFKINIDEDVGVQTIEEVENIHRKHEVNERLRKKPRLMKRQFSKSEEETMNILKAWRYLNDLYETSLTDPDVAGMLELSDELKSVHKILMTNVIDGGITQPGVYSDRERYVIHGDEKYKYPMYTKEEMERKLETLECRVNSLLDHIKCIRNPSEKLKQLFKCVAYFLYEFLDLHPFGDGNGRLGRLLGSYIMRRIVPFPSPIFNIYATSRRIDYINALVACRKSETKRPSDLAAMIVECNWASWKKFLDGCRPTP